MSKKSSSKLICPYCVQPISVESQDHIFNKYLGGKRKIPACKTCNNNFGDTFEGQAAKDTLHRLCITISDWGIPLKINYSKWEKAFNIKGHDFDINLNKGKIIHELSKPIVQRGNDGEIIAISFRNKEEAERTLRKAKLKGKAASAKVEKIQIEIEPRVSGILCKSKFIE